MPTYDTSEPITATIEIGVGVIRITATDRADTVVEVRPSDPGKPSDVSAAEQTRVEYAAGRLLIKAPTGGWRNYLPWRGGESIDVDISLPEGSKLEGGGGVATLTVTGRLGDCHFRTGLGAIRIDSVDTAILRTGFGDLSVESVQGRAEVSTGSGALRVGSIGGSAFAKNSNGEIRIGDVGGALEMQSANGDLTVDRAGAVVSARTANGSIRIGEVAKDSVVAKTALGSIDIGVRPGVAAWLELSTHFGTARSELGDASAPQPGEPTVEIRAATAMGDISVHPATAVASASGRG